jgi:hypothetical protein
VDATWVSLWKSLVCAFDDKHLVHRDEVMTSGARNALHFSTAKVDARRVSLWRTAIGYFAVKHLHHRVDYLRSACVLMGRTVFHSECA